ncbi:MAG: methyltransferase domain-containing protein [Bermanella sp.]
MKTPREIKKHYNSGDNITSLLRDEFKEKSNTQDIIEISYDMQTGSYSEAMQKKEIALAKGLYTKEICNIIKSLDLKPNTILEAGVGEATTLGGVIKNLKDTDFFGFDLSWSRIAYARKWLSSMNINNVTLCLGDLFDIPFQNNSIDIVYTSHSIEPNGGNEEAIIKELYRVARDYLILLEPAYELSNNEIKKRMDQHGYCKNISNISKELGYNVVKHELFPHSANPMNPTAITIIKKEYKGSMPSSILACPKFKTPLEKINGALYSHEGLSVYPIIDNIPCLKIKHSIFASKYEEFKA